MLINNTNCICVLINTIISIKLLVKEISLSKELITYE